MGWRRGMTVGANRFRHPRHAPLRQASGLPPPPPGRRCVQNVYATPSRPSHWLRDPAVLTTGLSA